MGGRDHSCEDCGKGGLMSDLIGDCDCALAPDEARIGGVSVPEGPVGLAARADLLAALAAIQKEKGEG